MGAKRINILLQFLWEAIIITFLGAVFGVIFGIVLSWLIAIVANAQGFPWRFVILPSSLLLASSVAVLTDFGGRDEALFYRRGF